MKASLAAFCFLLVVSSISAQNFNTMTGDWMRVKAEFQDGGKLPRNHDANFLQRYSFTEDQVYLIAGNNTLPSKYTRTGGILNIALIQTYVIEKYDNKTLTILEGEGDASIRYYLIPLDSFTRSGMVRYNYTVSNADTIYTSTVGIEPIYPKGTMILMNELMKSLAVTNVGFEYTYVVKKDGTIGEIEILVSSDPKKNKRLIQAVKQSSGKWIPGTLRGKPIHVKLKEKFTLTNK